MERCWDAPHRGAGWRCAVRAAVPLGTTPRPWSASRPKPSREGERCCPHAHGRARPAARTSCAGRAAQVAVAWAAITRAAERQPAQAVQHLRLRSRDRDARSARPAAAAARSSGRRGRWRRAAPGRRTGRSRPRRPWCPARSGSVGGELVEPRGAWRRRRPRRRSLPGRANRMLSRIEPANSTGRWPIQAVRRDSACGTRSVMSAPLMVTRPLSGRTKPSRISITVDLPAPDGPASTSGLAGGDAERQPVQRRPARGVPGQAHVLERDGDALRGDGADLARAAAAVRQRRQIDQRLGGAGGVQPVLVGGGEGAQRGEELRRQQQHEQRRPQHRRQQPSGAQCDAIVDRQHDHRQRGGEVQRDRGQERHPQHAHGARSATRRRPAASGVRLVLGAAVQHDGGDAAHAVEEARLQAGQRQELVARGGGGADARRPPSPTGTSRPHSSSTSAAQRIGPQHGEQHQRRARRSRRSPPARSGRTARPAPRSGPPRWSPDRRSGAPRSSAGPACSRRDSASLRSRRRAAAPACEGGAFGQVAYDGRAATARTAKRRQRRWARHRGR